MGIVKKTLADAISEAGFASPGALQCLGQEDSLGQKTYLSYDPAAGWAVTTLNYGERVWRFITGLFLKCVGLGYRSDTHLDHIFKHRHYDIGHLSTPYKRALNQRILELYNKKRFGDHREVAFFDNLPLSQTKNFFSDEFRHWVDLKQAMQSILYQQMFDHTHRLQEEKSLENLQCIKQLLGDVQEELASIIHTKETYQLTPAQKNQIELMLQSFTKTKKELSKHLALVDNASLIETVLNEHKSEKKLRTFFEQLGVVRVSERAISRTNSLSEMALEGPVGIENEGNSCYLIASFQALFATQHFHTYLAQELVQDPGESGDAFEKRKELFDILKQLQQVYQAPNTRQKQKQLKLYINNFRNCLYRSGLIPDFSQEYYQRESEALRKIAPGQKKYHSLRGLSVNDQQDAFMIVQAVWLVLGKKEVEYEQVTRSLESEHPAQSLREESVPYLQVAMAGNDLQSCIDQYFEETECDALHAFVEGEPRRYAATKIQLKRAPNLLPVQLTRFNNALQKIGGPITVNHVIDLSAHIEGAEPGSCRYRVKSVVTHVGASLRGGHYVADICEEETYFHCNDTSVRVANQQSTQASYGYLFFLEKIEQAEEYPRLFGAPAPQAATPARKDLVGLNLQDPSVPLLHLCRYFSPWIHCLRQLPEFLDKEEKEWLISLQTLLTTPALKDKEAQVKALIEGFPTEGSFDQSLQKMLAMMGASNVYHTFEGTFEGMSLEQVLQDNIPSFEGYAPDQLVVRLPEGRRLDFNPLNVIQLENKSLLGRSKYEIKAVIRKEETLLPLIKIEGAFYLFKDNGSVCRLTNPTNKSSLMRGVYFFLEKV